MGGLLHGTRPRDSVGRPGHRVFNPYLQAATPTPPSPVSNVCCGGGKTSASLPWGWGCTGGTRGGLRFPPRTPYPGDGQRGSSESGWALILPQDWRQSWHRLFKKDGPTFPSCHKHPSVARQSIPFLPRRCKRRWVNWHRFVTGGVGGFVMAVTTPLPKNAPRRSGLPLVSGFGALLQGKMWH